MNKFDKALKYEIFENKEYGILDDFIRNSKNIWDIGGYKGFFSLYCKIINKDVKIGFFEPVKNFFDEAKNNLKDYSDIVFNNYGVYSTDGEMNICVEKNKGMQSSVFEKNFMVKDFELESVRMLSLDKLLDNVDNIDILKMDIEGCEFEALNSVSFENLQKIAVIFCEYHLIENYDKNDLKSLLDKLSEIYKNVYVYENKYSDKLGYIYCKK